MSTVCEKFSADVVGRIADDFLERPPLTEASSSRRCILYSTALIEERDPPREKLHINGRRKFSVHRGRLASFLDKVATEVH